VTRHRPRGEITSREDLLALAARINRALRPASSDERVVLSPQEHSLLSPLAASSDLLDRGEDPD
jgi:hypothetical protein